MTDYNNETQRFVNLGLNIRNDPDKVSQGHYTILTNTRSPKEGSLSTRIGRTLDINTGHVAKVHTIKRISNSFIALGVGTRLYRGSTQFSTAGYSGNPLSLVVFRPAISSSVWTYVADSNKMRKVREDGADFKWGINPPTVAATATPFGTGNLDSSVAGAIVYDWRYTYYSSVTGAESNPSPIMSGVAVVLKRANVGVQPSTDSQVDTIRVYRRGGTAPDVWTLTSSGPTNSTNIEDNNADSAILLSKELDLDNDVPFTSINSSGGDVKEVALPYAWGPFLGKYILACGDPNRRGHVYWTNAERPDSADVANNVPVTPPNEELLGGFIFSSTPFVWSGENLYFLDFGGPSAVPKFVPRKTNVGKGISAPWAFCQGPFIWFLSKDGIYFTDGQTRAESITEETISPIFHGITVNDIAAVDYTKSTALRLFYADLKVHFIYQDSSSNYHHLAYHTLYNRWERESTSGFSEIAIYQDEKIPGTTVYVGGSVGKVYTISGSTDDGATISSRIRTGSLNFGQGQTMKELGNVIFDTNPQSNVITVTPFLDAETSSLAAQTMTGSGRQKIPLSLSDTYLYSLAFDFQWNGTVDLYEYDLLWRGDEELIKHWEFPETSHGQHGWQHIRDIFLSYRSTSPLTLTMTIDGVVHTYTNLFPSTGGGRRKIHAFLDPVKGKVFRYAIDSSAGFRLYGEDCEVMVKPWNTQQGYQLISPFLPSSGGS